MNPIDNPTPEELMSASIDGDALLIRIPLDLLVFAQKQREDPIIIQDEKKMAEYLVQKILQFGGDSETGSSAFEVLLDECFVDALESAEDWLLGWWENEAEDEEEE